MSGAERIRVAFETSRANGFDAALIPFVCAGDPTLESTRECLTSFGEAGASIIEVGIPYSDPIADGPTIASAMHRALERGVTVRGVLDLVASARTQTQTPFVAMVSCSIAQRFGPEAFAHMLADAGFDGVIYPDLPLEESPAFTDPLRALGLTASLLVSPATPAERAAEIARASDGFVYAMARTGITGHAQQGDDSTRDAYLDGLRRASGVPVACGFGISTPEDARAVAAHADGVIVGSAIVKAMTDAHRAGDDPVAGATELVRSLANAAHAV